MSGRAVTSNIDAQIGRIEINRPTKRNALSSEVIEELGLCLQNLSNSDGVRIILLSTVGSHFSAGADLEEVLKLVKSRRHLTDFIQNGHNVFSSIETLPVPVVASVQGLCLAGGLELILACDIVIAADTAEFGDQHVNFGFVPGWGGSQRLIRQIGQKRSLDIMMTGRRMNAAEALEYGLVNHVVPAAELDLTALNYCRELAAKSPAALTCIKQMAIKGSDLPLDHALSVESEFAVEHLMSKDAIEGLEAFSAKRRPDFNR